MARFLLVLALLTGILPAIAMASESWPPDARPSDTKAVSPKAAETKPVAHFATLRAEKVNLRTGPSVDYPIEWVFVRKGLPVEILAAFDTWRKIRDSEGTEGWVHQGMLSGRRSVLVVGAVRALRHDPKLEGAIVAQLDPGVVARISRCNPTWCEVKVRYYRGWIERDELWGLEGGEIIQ